MREINNLSIPNCAFDFILSSSENPYGPLWSNLVSHQQLFGTYFHFQAFSLFFRDFHHYSSSLVTVKKRTRNFQELIYFSISVVILQAFRARAVLGEFFTMTRYFCMMLRKKSANKRVKVRSSKPNFIRAQSGELNFYIDVNRNHVSTVL